MIKGSSHQKEENKIYESKNRDSNHESKTDATTWINKTNLQL